MQQQMLQTLPHQDPNSRWQVPRGLHAHPVGPGPRERACLAEEAPCTQRPVWLPWRAMPPEPSFLACTKRTAGLLAPWSH